MKPRLFLMPIAAISVALLIACGGDKKDGADAASNIGGTSSSQSASSSGNGSLDLSKTAEKLAALKSFHFDMSMKLNAGSAASSSGSSGSGAGPDAFAGAILGMLGDVKAEGAYVSPDKSDIKIKVIGMEIGMIQIGDKSWSKFGNNWTAGSAGDSLGIPSNPTSVLTDALPGEVLKGGKTSQEKVNGVNTTRYSFNKAALEKLIKDSGQDVMDFKDLDKADLNVWMNGDDIPVKIAVTVDGKDEKGQKVSLDLQMNIKDINSNITIKAPI